MKYVRALAAQPPLLQQYNANHPDQALRPAAEADATWTTFKEDKQAYGEVLDYLIQAQQGLCCYCEQRLVDLSGKRVDLDYQVEHVLPKSGAVGRVLHWQNLALACCGGTYRYHKEPSRQYKDAENISCGQMKGDDELACDPRNLPLHEPLITVGIDGRLKIDAERCQRAGVSQADVQNSIKLLNLDCERLRKTREDIGNGIRTWFTTLLSTLTSSQLTAAQQRTAVELLIAARLQPDAQGNLLRFWSAERSALGEAANTWIMGQQAIFT
ncbi:MAG: TIGR02646 family protein [Hyphomicrobiales bacterium]|nr:MAG: TIGR02646 family protein [Hyphomicrobiales bacterium]